MSTPNYDVYYFIKKFAAIPEELWCVERHTDGDKHCALGWCSNDYDLGRLSESRALHRLLHPSPGFINDGLCFIYQQPTPKERILAALRDVACSQLPDDEECE